MEPTRGKLGRFVEINVTNDERKPRNPSATRVTYLPWSMARRMLRRRLYPIARCEFMAGLTALSVRACFIITPRKRTFRGEVSRLHFNGKRQFPARRLPSLFRVVARSENQTIWRRIIHSFSQGVLLTLSPDFRLTRVTSPRYSSRCNSFFFPSFLNFLNLKKKKGKEGENDKMTRRRNDHLNIFVEYFMDSKAVHFWRFFVNDFYLKYRNKSLSTLLISIIKIFRFFYFNVSDGNLTV